MSIPVRERVVDIVQGCCSEVTRPSIGRYWYAQARVGSSPDLQCVRSVSVRAVDMEYQQVSVLCALNADHMDSSVYTARDPRTCKIDRHLKPLTDNQSHLTDNQSQETLV